MITKRCDRCGELINPRHPWARATTRVSVIVSDPRDMTQCALDLCYECQQAVFFCALPTGKWFNGTDCVKQGETK